MTDPVFGNQKTGSIRDIPIPGKESKKPLDLKDIQHMDEGIEDARTPRKNNKKTGLKLVIGIIGLVILLFIISSLLHKGEITIWPKTETVSVGQSFTATSNGQDDTLAFSRLAGISKEISVFIEGTKEENIQTKASGKIIVKNATGSEQRFIPNTRFETPGGLVYRTPRSVVIPARGQTEISVTADVPGAEYNSEGGHSFVVPGLRGTDSFTSFSATQSGPITGGFSGVIKTASSEDIAAQKEVLETQIKQELTSALVSNVPDGFILNNDLLSFSDIVYAEKPNEDKGGIDLVAEATVEALTFNKEDFDAHIAQAVLTDYVSGQGITIKNAEDIKMDISSEDFSPANSDEFEFSISGDPVFVWEVNEDSLASEVAGRKISHIENGLISEVAQADKVDVVVSPFWRNSLPNNVNKIEINVITE